MDQQKIPEAEPLRDVFAAQGIIVILAAAAAVILHIVSPARCNALLAAWHRIYEESPDIEKLAAQLCEWFASVFAG